MKIAICDDVIEDFLNAPDSSQFHLLFLDIEMKGLTGIELKTLLEKTNPSIFIVFTTTHEEMMPEAFGRNVISFLTKPLDLNSIKHCICILRINILFFILQMGSLIFREILLPIGTRS